MKSGVVEDRAEPAQREASVVGSVERVLGRERDQADDHERREHEHDHERVEDEGEGPFLLMTTSLAKLACSGLRAPGCSVSMITQVGDQQRERDGRAERPVQLVQVFVVDQRGHHLQAASAEQAGNGERARRQAEHDQAARQHARA